LLSDCEALIIDLRNNGGGWGQAVALLSTYFFPESGEQKELTSVYSRPEDKLYQSWTLPYVPGTRLSNSTE
jgi:C-terminal processing protease CtpA/Prc